MIPGMENGIGSTMRSPYCGFAARMKPARCKSLAVLRIAETLEVWLRKPVEKVQITMLPRTMRGSNASGCWHSSVYGGVLGNVPFSLRALLARTSLYVHRPLPSVGPDHPNGQNMSKSGVFVVLLGLKSYLQPTELYIWFDSIWGETMSVLTQYDQSLWNWFLWHS